MRLLAACLLLAGCSFQRTNGVGPMGDDDLPPDGDVVMPDMAMASCPVSYAIAHGTHRYKLTDKDYTWDEARDYCAQDGGHLVKIESVDEDDFIAHQIDANEHRFVWIGLHRSGSTFQWRDGSSLGGYDHWAILQPGSDDCVDKNTEDIDGTWATFSCGTKERGFCECDG